MQTAEHIKSLQKEPTSNKKSQPATAVKIEPRPQSNHTTQKRKSVDKRPKDKSHSKRRTNSEKKLKNRWIDHRESVGVCSRRLITQQYREVDHKRYINAQRCKSRIETLRTQVVGDSLRKLQHKHNRQRHRIKRAHIEQIQELDQFYSSMVNMHKKDSNDMYAMWQKKQRRDLAILEKSMDVRDKQLNTSAEILTLNQIEQKLVEREMYMEAGRIHKDLIQAQQRRRQSIDHSRQDKSQHLRKNLWMRHRKEYNVMMERIRRNSEQHYLKYQKQRNKLQKRYQNVMSQLQRQQLHEINKLNRSASMLQRFMNFSPNNVRWIIESQQLQ